MRSVADSLRYGKKYINEYNKAISKIWEHDKIIAGVPLEHWFISQITQESRWNSEAVSPVGARGVAQFMPDTAREMEAELRVNKLIHGRFDITNVVHSIYAQVLYINGLFNLWKSKRSDTSRMLLALASYNAGAGNILKAQKLANGAKHWVEIREKLRSVTGGKHSQETLGYVDNILNYALILVEV